jgi:hypothetical protein
MAGSPLTSIPTPRVTASSAPTAASRKSANSTRDQLSSEDASGRHNRKVGIPAEAELSTHAKLLDVVIEVFSVLIDPAVAPKAGSLAAGELHAARDLRTDGGVWGEGPL